LKILDQVENGFGKSVEVLTLKYDIYKSMGKNDEAISQLYAARKMEPENLSVAGLIAEFTGITEIRTLLQRTIIIYWERKKEIP